MGKRRKEGVRGSLSESSGTSVAKLEEVPTNLSQVVRLTLRSIGDPNAKAAIVKARALEDFPKWKKEIEGAKFWSSYVTQSRDKVAEELGIDRKVQTGGGGSASRGTLAFKDYQNANEFVERYCGGDLKQAGELLEFVRSANITRLCVAMTAWTELVGSVGSPEAALKALETLSNTGGVVR